MTLNTVSTSTRVAPDACAKPSLTFDSFPPEARFPRKKLAELLTACGAPVSAATLATKASRGRGPKYQVFGRVAIYTWGPSVAWALAEMGEPARSASEHRAKAGERQSTSDAAGRGA
jgi:hypothetical protein